MQEPLKRYLKVGSEILEAWDEKDESAMPYLLPKGGYFEIVKSFTPDPKPLQNLETGETIQPQTLYWIKFGNSKRRYLVAPKWWQYDVVSSLPDPITRKPKDEQIANAMYKLVRIQDDT